MKSLWTLLAVVVVLFSVLLRTTASEWPDTYGVVVENQGNNDNFNEFEDKIIRTWLENIIDKYYKNIQPSAKSANIQRIAKKSRMSASSIPVLKHRNASPFPVFPVIFKPYYPNVFPSYIPISHGPTTHLIPISQEEYYQRFIVPLNTHFPYGYSHFPDIASSTPVNHQLNVKKPFNVLVYTPQQNQGEIRKYDKPEEIIDTIKELSNQNPSYDFEQALPTGLEEPYQTDNIKDENNESPNPTRDGKLLDNVDSPPESEATQLNQTTESHEGQHSLTPNTANALDTSTPQDKIVSSERYDVHFTSTSMRPIDGSSASEIFNGLVTQRPLDAKYHLSDTFSTTPQFTSVVITTLEPSTSNVDQSETTVETETPTTSGYFDEERSNTEEKNQQSKPRDAEYGVLSLNGTTTGIPKSLIKTERKTTKTIETTQNPETLITLVTSPPPRPTTMFRSTTLCENNDCRGLKSSHLTTPSRGTTEHVNAYDTSIPVKTINSTTQSTRVNSEYGNQTNLVSTSTRPSSLTSTTISETTTMSYKTSTSSTTIKLSSPTIREVSTPLKPSYFKMPVDKVAKIQLTSLPLTSTTPRSQPLNDNNSTAPTLLDSKINQTLSATTNGNNFLTNIKRNVNVPMHSDESTLSFSTTTVSSLPIETIIKADQIIVPSSINKSPIKPLIQIQTTTEKVYIYKGDKIDHSIPVTVKEAIKSTLKPIVTQIKPLMSTPRTSIIVTNGSKYRNSAPNRDRYMAETTQSSQTTKDSDLWYSHINTQSPNKKELNSQEIDYLLKKLIKLLKPEIEKQSLTNDSISRFITPKIGDREKLVYIIFPMIRDAAKSMNSEERKENSSSSLKNTDKK